MKKHVFECLGRRIELWTYPEPDHLASAIGHGMFYEPDLLMKCHEIYLPGTVILDIGANIGNHTVFFAAVLGARVHAFEPFQPSLRLLEINLAANGIEGQVQLHPCALGAEDGGGRVLAPRLPANPGTVRVAAGGDDVPIQRLDGLDLPGPVGLLKIDVEGAEADVLDGGRALIAAWLPDIMVEAGEPTAFKSIAHRLLGMGYVPRGRYAWTATYLFSAIDQAERMRRVLAAL
jgi:FkbM family methyltransferase